MNGDYLSNGNGNGTKDDRENSTTSTVSSREELAAATGYSKSDISKF